MFQAFDHIPAPRKVSVAQHHGSRLQKQNTIPKGKVKYSNQVERHHPLLLEANHHNSSPNFKLTNQPRFMRPSQSSGLLKDQNQAGDINTENIQGRVSHIEQGKDRKFSQRVRITELLEDPFTTSKKLTSAEGHTAVLASATRKSRNKGSVLRTTETIAAISSHLDKMHSPMSNSNSRNQAQRSLTTRGQHRSSNGGKYHTTTTNPSTDQNQNLPTQESSTASIGRPSSMNFSYKSYPSRQQNHSTPDNGIIQVLPYKKPAVYLDGGATHSKTTTASTHSLGSRGGITGSQKSIHSQIRMKITSPFQATGNLSLTRTAPWQVFARIRPNTSMEV